MDPVAAAETPEAFRQALAERYRVLHELGAGGMATVHLAEDLKHHRRVALKILKRELAAVIGVDRFLKEIELTASLQHPHILPLYDSGAADGLLYYVMPYVEGESLRGVLNRERQLGIEQTVAIATGVAAALQFAHEKGIIHRDIKPENILLTGGQPMVADFGIALAISRAAGTRLTETGLSVGTPQYMSPEQATGDRDLDARSDVYSLGAVVYEMLAGAPPHAGPTAQAIIAALLTREPPRLRAQRRSVPEHIDHAVHKALQTLPADRFASTTAFAEALRLAPPSPPLDTGARGHVRRRSRTVVLSLAGGIAAATVFALGMATGWMARPSPVSVERLETHFPREQAITYLGLAYPPPYALADGSGFVYAGVDGAGVNRVFRRPFAAAAAEPVPGATGDVARAWVFPSPDGKQLALLTVPGLRTFVMPLAGGTPTQLTDSLFGILSWSSDSKWIYGIHNAREVAARIPATGGPIQQLAAPDPTRRTGHWMPDPLPGGRGVLITVRSGSDRVADAQVAVVDPAGRVTTLTQGFAARYVPSGHIVFARADGALYAAPFDVDRLEMSGAPAPVVRDVIVLPQFFALFSVGRDGSLLYLPASQTTHRDGITLVDRSGRELSTPIEQLVIRHPRLSPDGTRVAFEGSWDVFIHTLSSATTTPLTRRLTRSSDATAEAWSSYPTWRDNRSVTVSAMKIGGSWHLRNLRTDRPVVEEVLVDQPDIIESRWRPAGGLVFVQESRGRGTIRYTDPSSPSHAVLFGDTLSDEHSIDLSSDGHRLAYVADGNVWVTRFPDGGDRVQISGAGGAEPRWSPTGAELFYRVRDSLMVASMRISDTIKIESRRALFSVRAYQSDPRVANYDVSSDGARFVFVKTLGEDRPQYVVVDRRWTDRLPGPQHR